MKQILERLFPRRKIGISELLEIMIMTAQETLDLLKTHIEADTKILTDTLAALSNAKAEIAANMTALNLANKEIADLKAQIAAMPGAASVDTAPIEASVAALDAAAAPTA